MLTLLEEAYGYSMRVIHRQLPLVSIHPNAFPAAEASEAAGAQGAFWPMHDILFERAQEWSAVSPEQALILFSGYAAELGLDTQRFNDDMQNHTYQQKVQQSYDTATDLGFTGTPTIIVNGYRYPAGQGISVGDFIQLILLEPHKYSGPPSQVIDPNKQYVATIRTQHGDVVIELYADKAPVTVNSFVFLARDGWYDGVTFHRVIPGFVAQTGDPSGSGAGSPGYRCSDEIAPGLTFDGPGVVGMASGGPGTNSVGSQFFITYDAQPDLNGNYTIIGRVVQGMDVLLKITPREPGEGVPPGDTIETIVITEQ